VLERSDIVVQVSWEGGCIASIGGVASQYVLKMCLCALACVGVCAIKWGRGKTDLCLRVGVFMRVGGRRQAAVLK